jgi:hypothetical protein
MQIGEATNAGSRGGPEPASEDDDTEPAAAVEAMRIEIYTQSLASTNDAERHVAPLSTDGVRAWAVIWARERDSGGEPRPYTALVPTFPEATRRLHNVGRGGADAGRPDRARARPDLTSAFRPPQLAALSAQNYSLPDADPWPVDWPAPQFEWSELGYTTERTGADDPRSYVWSNGRALTADAASGGWTVHWPDGLAPGVHRLRVKATIDGTEITCPRDDAQRDAGYVTTLLVRDGRIAGPDQAVHARALAELPFRLPAPLPQAIPFLRWMSALLETPYERGGCWVGGTALHSDGAEPPLGYQGYGVDCTGLPSAAWTLAGLPQPSNWRFSTHRQHNPLPAVPLYDRHSDWTWTARGWRAREGSFMRYGPNVLAYVQPGDFFDSGPNSELNHIRFVYAVEGRGTDDAEIRIIEASSSEAGNVRFDPTSGTMSLRDCLTQTRNGYGLWRPCAQHPTADPFAGPGG